MQILITDGMINIETDDLSYGNISNMYKDGGSGHGLQLNDNLEHKRGEIIDLCANISDLIYELQNVIKRGEG